MRNNYKTIEAFYEDGQIKPPLMIPGKFKVYITFIPEEKECNNELFKPWEMIKAKIAQRQSKLLNLSREDAKKDFDTLSEKAAQWVEQNFKNWQEAESFMRRDAYGIARH